jgi:hypothetical protein
MACLSRLGMSHLIEELDVLGPSLLELVRTNPFPRVSQYVVLTNFLADCYQSAKKWSKSGLPLICFSRPTSER